LDSEEKTTGNVHSFPVVFLFGKKRFVRFLDNSVLLQDRENCYSEGELNKERISIKQERKTVR